MSNAQYRNADAPSRTSINIAREKLVREAVQKLYLAKGGSQLDLDIRLCEATVTDALICRESDNRRLTENPDAQREPGERPIITVSEGRLHARELVRFVQMREEARMAAKNSIEEAISRARPATEEELKEVLEAASQDVSGVGRLAMFAPREVGRSDLPLEALATAAGRVSMKLSEDDQKLVLNALKRRSEEGVLGVILRQSNEIQDDFNVYLNRITA